ncbi:carboxymuconolactone decarboxylase family protein [Aliamphritea spongicola]|uniref:carboxymuconolactone decarboxylase family protein n=1 Tax=Aliamphritea spongicola TaxID=707589 RepID=UPI00196B7EE0|nr:peroxidase-related enzyme [Aliamphritea spongicola]MBN3562096.1 peroxidase-related enzyme [Aliamphritea spongicola]
MSRINVVERNAASAEQGELLDAIQAQLGMVPNFLKVFANSPVALKAFLGLHGVAGDGELDGETRERIALALAQTNSCQYCLSAHTALGRKAGLESAEIAANREGASLDDNAAVAVKFALSLAENTGAVTNSELLVVREAGYNDAQIVEIITHVAMNLLTNMLAKASQVSIDFPEVDLKLAG